MFNKKYVFVSSMYAQTLELYNSYNSTKGYYKKYTTPNIYKKFEQSLDIIYKI